MPKRTDKLGIVLMAAVVAAIACSALGQIGSADTTEKIEKWNIVERVCGKVEYGAIKKTKGGVLEEHYKELRGVPLRLYKREAGVSCCDHEALVFQTESRRGGKFASNIKDGRYWLVAGWNGKEYRMPLTQDSKLASKDSPCEVYSFAIEEDGRFQLLKTIQVD